MLRVHGLKNQVHSASLLLAPQRKLTVTESNGVYAIALPSVPVDRNDTVVTLKLDGAPRVDPVVLTQGTGLPLELDYQAAVTSGHAVKRFNREGKFHIAKWTGPDDTASWRVLISQPGTYTVDVRYSARQESAGDAYQVMVGTQSLNGTVTATGDGYQYRAFPLGTITIKKSGEYRVQLLPLHETSHNLMYFQAIDLIPDGPLMVE
jgi:hypothetical protein